MATRRKKAGSRQLQLGGDDYRTQHEDSPTSSVVNDEDNGRDDEDDRRDTKSQQSLLQTGSHRYIAFFVANLVVTVIVAVVVSIEFSSCNQHSTIDEAKLEAFIRERLMTSIDDEMKTSVRNTLMASMRDEMKTSINEAIASRLQELDLSKTPTVDVQPDDELSVKFSDIERKLNEWPSPKDLENIKKNILKEVNVIIEKDKTTEAPGVTLPTDDLIPRLGKLEVQIKDLEDREPDRSAKVEECLKKVTSVNGSVVNLLEEVSRLNTSTNDSISELESLHQDVTYMVGNMSVNVSTLESWKTELQGEFTSLVENFTGFKTELFDKTLPRLTDETQKVQTFAELVNDTMMDNLTMAKEKLQTGLEKETERRSKELERLGLTVDYYNESNKEMKSNLSYYVVVTMVLLVLVILAVLYIYGKMPEVIRGGQDFFYSQRKSNRAPLGQGPGRPTLRRLCWNKPMESSVCVVVFHAQTEKQHVDETRSVFESVGEELPNIRTSHVRSHKDIENLPGCNVFLIFVDFNERNIILEDPEKGLGDLRVTTVRSLWAFGADVTVIYCGDTGSRRLTSDLFNRELSSVFSHPEMSQLKEQKRMLSVYEGFSEYQRTHVRNVINSLIPRR